MIKKCFQKTRDKPHTNITHTAQYTSWCWLTGEVKTSSQATNISDFLQVQTRKPKKNQVSREMFVSDGPAEQSKTKLHNA